MSGDDVRLACDVDGCANDAVWVYVGESGDVCVCDEHNGAIVFDDGWAFIDPEVAA